MKAMQTNCSVFIKFREFTLNFLTAYFLYAAIPLSSFTFAPSKEYTLVGKTAEPKPISKYEKVFNMNVGYFENSVVFQQKVKLKSAKAAAVKGKLEFMTCNDQKCLPPDEVEFSIPLGK
jgi:hypothetical protein